MTRIGATIRLLLGTPKPAAKAVSVVAAPIISNGELLFRMATEAECKRDYVRGLSDASLRELNGWLSRRGQINGTPGDVWSVVVFEAARRFTKGGAK